MFALETKAEAAVHQAGREVANVFLEKEGNRIFGRVTGGAGCRIRLVNCICRKAEGAFIEVQGKDTVLTCREDDAELSVFRLND